MKKPAPSVIEAVEQSLADNAELLKRLAEPRSSDVFPCALCRKPFALFDDGNLCSACRGDAPRTDKPVPEGPSWREQAERLSEMCGTTNTSDETDIRAIATALRDAYVEGRRSAQRTETPKGETWWRDREQLRGYLSVLSPFRRTHPAEVPDEDVDAITRLLEKAAPTGSTE